MKAAWLSFLLIFVSAAARAATVYLRDGSTVTGNVTKTGSKEVEIDTPQGSMRIPAERIDHVDYGEQAPAAPAAPRGYQLEPARRRAPEFSEPKHTLSLHLGAGVPFGDLDYAGAGGSTQHNGDWGPLLGVQYAYQATPRFGLGAEFDWAHRSIDDSIDSLPNAETQVWGDSLIFLGLAKVRLATTGWARPFILAGVGGDETSTIAEATPLPGFVWADTGTPETRTVVDGQHWGFAATARLGVDFLEAPAHLFALEIGWMHVSSRTYDATGVGRGLGLSGVHAPVDFLTFAARWGFSFGEGAP